MTDTMRRALSTLELPSGQIYQYFRLGWLEEQGAVELSRLPYSLRVLLEAAMRNCDGVRVTRDQVEALAGWQPRGERSEFPFVPTRVVLQDFTGVPAVVDLAGCRDAVAELGGDPDQVNPAVDVDLVIDHSVQVDVDGRHPNSLMANLDHEYRRNEERYRLLEWARQRLARFRVVPPGRGIVHQVNLEWLASVVGVREAENADTPPMLQFDTVVGTDSHTTMINGLGVLGWGVGGIEAEAAMLEQPIDMLAPDVVGFRLTGARKAGVTATDLTLRIVELLRAANVVGKFVEFCGPSLDQLSLSDRATIANMAPEYGATCGYFPIDEQTLSYLRLTGRSEDHVARVEAYARAQGMFRTAASPEPAFTELLTLDMASVEPALAGPKRPQDRVELSAMAEHVRHSLWAERGASGHGVARDQLATRLPLPSLQDSLGHGDVVIAAITSCTNTSNPEVMIAAGLVARNAVRRGLQTKARVKTSLAPGSRVVTEYLEKSGLADDLAALGFRTVAYGCTTCIGNSGPLPAEVEAAIKAGDLVVGAVLSGNRNFEGRIHNSVKAAYLASPPLVVAYAITGSLLTDFARDPLGHDSEGKPVTLAELWPADEEIAELIAAHVDSETFVRNYAEVTHEPRWDAISIDAGDRFAWVPSSTYIRRPPFLESVPATPTRDPGRFQGARVLLKFGDGVTTDHISPAGAITADSPAGRYLRSQGVEPVDFNSYGSRRGNHEVMIRGTFANVRVRNELARGKEGGFTEHWPSESVDTVYDVAMRYAEQKTPLIVLAGHQYGTGSSRDWAAKGTALLGVVAVIAQSFERIHRSNLVGMGVLPLAFCPGESPASLGLAGDEIFDVELPESLKPQSRIPVRARCGQGSTTEFEVVLCINTMLEVEYFQHGGILPWIVRNLAG